MIKHELGKEITVSGHVVQIAAEFEVLGRAVRESFCTALGGVIGDSLYEECLRASKMSEDDAYTHSKRIEEHMDEDTYIAAKKMADKLIKQILG